MRMLPGSGKVTFCKLTDLEKRGSVSGETKGGTLLDHRMWVVMIPRYTRERTFIARLKKFLTAGQCFAIQFSEPSNGNITDKTATWERNASLRHNSNESLS